MQIKNIAWEVNVQNHLAQQIDRLLHSTLYRSIYFANAPNKYLTQYAPYTRVYS